MSAEALRKSAINLGIKVKSLLYAEARITISPEALRQLNLSKEHNRRQWRRHQRRRKPVTAFLVPVDQLDPSALAEDGPYNLDLQTRGAMELWRDASSFDRQKRHEALNLIKSIQLLRGLR